MKKKLIIIICSSVLVVALIITAISVALNAGNSAQAEVVPVSYLTTGYWNSSTIYGNVSNGYNQQLWPDGTKIINKVFVKEGDSVKKGDKLVEYDKTKLELEAQAAELDIKKSERSIASVQAELNTLYNTSPYTPPADPVIPDEPTPTPIPESKATLYDRLTPESIPFAGTGTSDDPYRFLCTEDCTLSKEFLEGLLGLSLPLPSATPTPSPTPDTTPNPIPSESPSPSDTASPSSSPESSEPPLNASIAFSGIRTGLAGRLNISSLTSTISSLIQEQEKGFAAIFEVHEENNENGVLRYAWKLDGSKNDGGYYIPKQEESEDTETPIVFSGDYGGTIEDGTAQYTREELDAKIKEKKAELIQLQYDSKQNSINYEKAKLELENATVLSVMDGTVISLTDIETAQSNSKPYLVVSGSTGIYITGSINESLLGSVSAGTEISANSWETGQVYSGKILEISKYPNSDTGGSANPNTSNYSFSAYLDNAEGISEGAGLDISIGESTSNDAIYLQAAYIRSDDGGKYVFKDDGGKLKKTYIATGQSIYSGEYIELKSGLSQEDKIAFPYGKTARDGVSTKDSTEGVMYG